MVIVVQEPEILIIYHHVGHIYIDNTVAISVYKRTTARLRLHTYHIATILDGNLA